MTGAPPGDLQSVAACSQIVGKAPKLEINVFLTGNVGFGRAGEVFGGLKREGWAPSGALSGVVGSVREARRGVRASRGELLRALGRSFWGSGEDFRMLPKSIFYFLTKLGPQNGILDVRKETHLL